MTAPRWIAEAIEATATLITPELIEATASALIERLPIEAMATAGCEAIINCEERTTPMGAALAMLSAMVLVLADGDPEVRQLTELYQGACRALDDAGVPYAQDPDDGPTEQLTLGARIRWLAQQRPIRHELQRMAAERDAARDRDRQTEALAEQRLLELNVLRAKHQQYIESVASAGGMAVCDHAEHALAHVTDLRSQFQRVAAERDEARATAEADRIAGLQTADAMAAQITELTTEIEAARGRLSFHVDELNAAHRTIGQAELDLAAARDRIVELEASAAEAAADYVGLLADNEGIKAKLHRASQDLRQTQDDFNRLRRGRP